MVAWVRPFLMFQGEAEAATSFYASLFPDARISEITRFGPESPGKEGAFRTARLELAGQSVMIFESPTKHAFTFTPAFSFFVECSSEEELRRLAGALGESGHTMMPLDNYGFSRLFVWLADRFGISWQLNLP